MAKKVSEVAAEMGVSMPERTSLVKSIGNWEHGRYRPRDPYPMLLSHAFCIDHDVLFGDPLMPSLRSPADILAAIMPEGDPLAPLGARSGRRIGPSTVSDLAARVHGLRLADDLLGGDDLIDTAFRELGAAVRLYREAAHAEEVGRALLTVIGEGAQIAGWIASDAGRHEEAARTYKLGISAAREAGDQTLESNLLGSLAYQIANTGDTGEAAALALVALEVMGSHSPGRARALAWDRLAWAHARCGDAQGAMRALGEANVALAGDRDEESPPYLYWVEAGELQVMEARVYTELHRPLRAVPLLTTVLARYDATHARELALYLSWLVVALADANEPEEAARTAARMLDLSADLASERTTQRARVMLGRLKSYRDVLEVRDLFSRYPLTA
ncbi:transcriptional regulator [Sinosporangium album]|uniref:transcriptional regulator n=1 Tax=Sinosporangium album TaxID=504805 RepID=UPI001FDEA5B8|nr:transcriptional regulator [Sinosporangium album]